MPPSASIGQKQEQSAENTRKGAIFVKMTNWTVKKWYKILFISGCIFQIVFLLELLLFSNNIVVDPSVHIISYDCWKQVVSEWNPAGFWERNYTAIIAVVKLINMLFQSLLGIELIYVFAKNKRFSLSRRKLFLGYLIIVLTAATIHGYIKYNVPFYRLYMYSIFTEMVAIYVVFLAKYIKRKLT